MIAMNRFVFAIVVFLASQMPMLLLWQLMPVFEAVKHDQLLDNAPVASDASASSPNPARTPNPAKATEYMPGPVDYLVGADPWFAGTILFWLVPWIALLVSYAIGSGFLLQPAREATSRWRRFERLLAIGFALGVIFALPWFYGLWLILTADSLTA